MAKLAKRGSATPAADTKTGLEDLEALQNEGSIVTVKGEDIVIRPFNFGQLLKALKHLANLGGVLSEEDGPASVIRALAQNSEDVVGLLMLSTGKTREYFEDLSAEEGIDLAITTYTVNKDFFVRTLTPKLSQLSPSTDSPEEQTSEKTEADTSKTGSMSSTS